MKKFYTKKIRFPFSFWTFFIAGVINMHVTQFQANLQTLHVRTLVGSGYQGLDVSGGTLWTEQVISSPWDWCLLSGSLITGSSALQESNRDVLLIPMAGLHQIWDRVRWEASGTEPTGEYAFCCVKGNENHDLDTGFLYVRESYQQLRGLSMSVTACHT
jgi:hypothetical protein